MAALDASEDLTAAAVSLHRLGALTSGMWRALGREVATAAERLDRQAQERLDDLQHRAHALDADPDAVMAAAMAMAHLEEHRETLDRLLPSLDEDVRRLAASEVLLGFTVEDEVPVEAEPKEDAPEETTDAPRLAVRIWLFLWPGPLAPAAVTLVPDIEEMARSSSITDREAAMSVEVETVGDLADVLAAACGLPVEQVLPVLSRLGLACWSAHQVDEDGQEEDDEGDEDEDDPDE